MTVKKLQNFIGGKYQSPINESVSDVIDPSTEQVYAHAPVSSAADVDHAYKVAAKLSRLGHRQPLPNGS